MITASVMKELKDNLRFKHLTEAKFREEPH